MNEAYSSLKPSPAPVPLKYRAFISYSHADTDWAKWLQRGLEGFKIDKDLAGRETARGAIPETLRPIFRDREDFTAGEALPEQTLAALDASAALIVICSPHSAKSTYVNEEIRSFKSRHPDRPVIPLIVAGKPDDGERECFPPALKFKLDAKGRVTKKRVELLAADAREEGDGKDLALAKVIAGLLGLSPDDVFRRAERERRAAARRKRRVQAAMVTLALLLVMAGVAWLNQDYLWQAWRWYGVIRPYMTQQVRPYVLAEDAEQALKPKDTFRECTKNCPEMVVVPAGKFIMGSRDNEGGHDTEGPQHEVSFANPFAASKFEITFDDWGACIDYGDCPQVSDRNWGRGTRPVINVSWDDAQRYVAWLSRMTGRPYRLLTEAEWEYAARAGTTTLYSFGDDAATLNDHGWNKDSSQGMTYPVGAKKPNAFGLYDVHGNANEWVEDCVHLNYHGAPTDGSAWTADGDCNARISRGGSWNDGADASRSAARGRGDAGMRTNNLGFRVARTLGR
jgi:formylglycine-generating enzyme required for sulfatase activity